MLTTGDLIKISVQGRSQPTAKRLLDELAADPEIAELMTPMPASSVHADEGDFGDLSLVQEFIIVAAAHFTAENLSASIRAALGRSQSRKTPEEQAEPTSDQHGTAPTAAVQAHTEEPEGTHVSVNVSAGGMTEVTIRHERPS
ncbi:hypothetical protein [Nonomuraea sp. SYSU D8015]|uniref:hypothetical protein n=1 Tax=Nonomuraea sp. SYSU D8015 TaxID=2593644 RepID=UPI001660DCB6|nr:hypothetical protein [Nonomuraea sp. SYSU D8015]